MDQPTPSNHATASSIRVGLVLGAGGSAGSAFIATALRVLAETTGFHGAQATRIVGTSAGAFKAARIGPAVDAPDVAMADRLRQLDNTDEWRNGPLSTAVRPLRALGGRLAALLAPTTGHEPTWSVAPPPFHQGAAVVTVELRRGRRRVHGLATTVDPARAVLASGAVPGVTKPVLLAGRRHIDGAVHSPTNADLLKPGELDALIVIAPMVPRDGGNVLGRIHRSLLRDELRAWQPMQLPLIVVAPSSADRRSRKDPDVFGRGAEAALARLAGRRSDHAQASGT